VVNPGFLFDLPAAERFENRPDSQFFQQLLVSEQQISSFPIGAQLAVILNPKRFTVAALRSLQPTPPILSGLTVTRLLTNPLGLRVAPSRRKNFASAFNNSPCCMFSLEEISAAEMPVPAIGSGRARTSAGGIPTALHAGASARNQHRAGTPWAYV
jgi:hypothetical protein